MSKLKVEIPLISEKSGGLFSNGMVIKKAIH